MTFKNTKNRENNIIYKNTKISNCLHLTDYTSIASDESDSNSTSSQPLATSSDINVIGVSFAIPEKKRPDRRKITMSIIRESGETKQYSSALVSWDRKRELKANVPDQARSYWGYDAAIEFAKNLPDRHSVYLGKLKNTTAYQYGVPRNMPIVANTACVLWGDELGLHVMLWLGNEEYQIDLYAEGLNEKQKRFYMANGYWRRDSDLFVVEDF